MSSRFASSQKALGICDICGFAYPLRKLRTTRVKGRKTNILSCPTCWDPDHPQLRLGELPVNDPQALRNPRPDSGEYAQSRALILPVWPVVGTGFIGQVTVVTS
jgi:hypothetical protein